MKGMFTVPGMWPGSMPAAGSRRREQIQGWYEQPRGTETLPHGHGTNPLCALPHVVLAAGSRVWCVGVPISQTEVLRFSTAQGPASSKLLGTV